MPHDRYSATTPRKIQHHYARGGAVRPSSKTFEIGFLLWEKMAQGSVLFYEVCSGELYAGTCWAHVLTKDKKMRNFEPSQ
jgi:hypothetical protein